MKFVNKGQTLLIDLNSTYLVSVTAKWNFKKEKYDVELYIRRKDITVFDEVGCLEIDTKRENLFETLTELIGEQYREGYFDKSISRYEYYIKCIERGIDEIEKENKVNKHV